ncbi:geranylgeranyl pyrophosphate synthetase [Thozetella sp. PMI_491]|nr:geranylgeranyl pyrophosphate synthetase [Thozetella sp. PMI_491]
MTSSIIAEISRHSIREFSLPPVASISEVEHLSSYSWIEASTPTIAVPGSPSLWSAPQGPRRLKKDSGLVYISQNAARHPTSPLEPLFRALYLESPSFNIHSIDVVTDRNNIRKLHSYISPTSNKYGLESFTINVEVINNTVLFCRTETKTQEIIGPHEFRGYGHELEKAYTRNHIRGSTGHHRLISYRFGGLKFVIRYEADGYVAQETPQDGKLPQDDDLSSMLSSLSLLPTEMSSGTIPVGSLLAVREEGTPVPHKSTLEIKTRVTHKPLEIRDVAPQLWVSQTPNLVRAYHDRGLFQKPVVENVSSEIKKWEDANQKDLRELAALISKIVAVVKDRGRNATITYDSKEDKLVICHVEDSKMLPQDLYQKWGGGIKDQPAPAGGR